MDVLLPPGKETHNHPYHFMTIPVSGDTPELPKNPGNSSRNKAHVHRGNWGGPSTCSSDGARWADWRSTVKHSRLGHNRRLQRFLMAGLAKGFLEWLLAISVLASALPTACLQPMRAPFQARHMPPFPSNPLLSTKRCVAYMRGGMLLSLHCQALTASPGAQPRHHIS